MKLEFASHFYSKKNTYHHPLEISTLRIFVIFIHRIVPRILLTEEDIKISITKRVHFDLVWPEDQ